MQSSRQIYLNSADASVFVGGSHSDVIWNFEDAIYVPDNYALTLGLLNAQIPASFYTIHSNNDALEYLVGGSTTSINLAHGNPNVTELISDILSKLPSAFGLTYSATTNKLTFTNSSTFSISGSCLPLLGFSSGTHGTTSGSLTGNQVVDLSGPRVILIESDFMTRSIDSRSKGSSNVLASIPNSEAPGTILAYSNLTGYFSRINARTISSLRLRLKDSADNLVDLQGLSWSATLQVNVVEQ